MNTKKDVAEHSAATDCDSVGWVVELESGVWLLAADTDPSRTLVLEHATRWNTERAARRAMSRVRRWCRHKFYGAKIYQG